MFLKNVLRVPELWNFLLGKRSPRVLPTRKLAQFMICSYFLIFIVWRFLLGQMRPLKHYLKKIAPNSLKNLIFYEILLYKNLKKIKKWSVALDRKVSPEVLPITNVPQLNNKFNILSVNLKPRKF